MPRNPVNRILIHMFFYGLAYGSLTSGLLFVALLFGAIQVAEKISDLTYSGFIGAFIFGFPFGLLVGGFAGICCGLAIIILIELFLPPQLNFSIIRTYRLSIGIVTALLSGGIFVLPFSCLLPFSIYMTNHVTVLGFFISIGIAMYASQQTLTKYLREIDPRKAKSRELA